VILQTQIDGNVIQLLWFEFVDLGIIDLFRVLIFMMILTTIQQTCVMPEIQQL